MVFKPIPLEIMQTDTSKNFALFIKQGSKYVLFAGTEVEFTAEHHGRLQEAGITTLYVRSQEREGLQDYTARHLEHILSNPGLKPRVKAEVFYSSSSFSIKRVFQDPRAATICAMKKGVQSMVNHLLEDSEVMQNLFFITAHDYSTYTHSINVGIFATALALKLFGKDKAHSMEAVSSAFFLHDIGKTRVPQRILTKPGALSKDEWDIIRKHPQWGAEILSQTGHLTPEAGHVVLYHHERHDGSGYPCGKTGDDIHIYARICAIADAYDALTTERCFKGAKRPFEALKIMQQEMQAEFDPHFFETFVLLFAPQKSSSAA